MSTKVTFLDGETLYIHPNTGEITDPRLKTRDNVPCAIREIPIFRSGGWSATTAELEAEAALFTPEEVRAIPTTYCSIKRIEGNAPHLTIYSFWGVDERIVPGSPMSPLNIEVREIEYRTGYVESW